MTTILVVDDQKVERQRAIELLAKNSDWQVIGVPGAGEALAHMSVKHADLVITELVLPRMNGRQLVEVMRSRYPNIPAIVITSRGNEQIAVRALEIGAAGYVSKKRLEQDLLGAVRQALARAMEQRAGHKVMQHMTRSLTKFVLRSEPRYVGPVVSYLHELMGSIGLCHSSDLRNITSALEEALLNSMYHGNLEASAGHVGCDREQYIAVGNSRVAQSPWKDRRIHIDAQITPALAKFTIRDEGPGFDTSIVGNIVNFDDAENSHGRGLVLMHKFMDDMTYNDIGNEVTLVKQATA